MRAPLPERSASSACRWQPSSPARQRSRRRSRAIPITHCDGGREALSRTVVAWPVMLAALPYAPASGIGALVRYLRYRKAP